MSGRHLIAALLCVVYFIISGVLGRQAMPYLKQPSPRWLETPLVDEKLFHPEGHHLVRRANRFALFGAFALAAALIVVYSF